MSAAHVVIGVGAGVVTGIYWAAAAVLMKGRNDGVEAREPNRGL